MINKYPKIKGVNPDVIYSSGVPVDPETRKKAPETTVSNAVYAYPEKDLRVHIEPNYKEEYNDYIEEPEPTDWNVTITDDNPIPTMSSDIGDFEKLERAVERVENGLEEFQEMKNQKD